MSWVEKTAMESRSEFILEAISGETNFSEVCRKYNITRKTGYKWLERYNKGEGLEEQSRRPFYTPNKTPEDKEALVLSERESHPVWGPRKLKKSLENKGYEQLPSTSTIAAILKRNDCITPQESLKHKPYVRFERAEANQLWQMDFKGDFMMANNQRCYPLTVLDDHSRFSLAIDAKENQQRVTVVETLERLFQAYGLPDSILCDNGNPWGNSQRTGFTQIEVWLMQLSILPIHGRMLHPQTQGKEERFHRTMKAELLSHTAIEDTQDAQKKFDVWRQEYNCERPHEALELDAPAKHYSKSKRKMPKSIKVYEYGEKSNLRKINENGYFSYQNKSYYLSEAFSGEKINMVKESDLLVKMQYREYYIGTIDLSENMITSKKIYAIIAKKQE